MKQSGFVERAAVGILDRQCAVGERLRHQSRVNGTARDHASAGGFGPDCGQMALAGPLRSDQRNGARRPICPAVDQGERSFVAGSTQKIRAIEAFPMTEWKTELARRGRIAHHHTLRASPILSPPPGGGEGARYTCEFASEVLICSTHPRT